MQMPKKQKQKGEKKFSLEKVVSKEINKSCQNACEPNNQTEQNMSNLKTKVVKKYVISNGFVTQQTKEVHEIVGDAMETEERTKVIDEKEAELDKKLERLKEREAKLSTMIEQTKQKELHLQVHENRLKRLAEMLRKQQNKLKQEEARRNLELDQLRAQVISRIHNHGKVTSSISNYFHFSDDLLKQACQNATITDLRLGLERKQKHFQMRYARLVKAEKDFQCRIMEFERIHMSLQEAQAKEYDGRTATKKVTVIKKEFKRNPINEDENIILSEQPTSNLSLSDTHNIRREAFVPATLPIELKKRNSTPKRIKEEEGSSTSQDLMSSMNPIALSNASDDKKKQQMNRRQSLPRSLIDYTNNHILK